MRFLAAAGITLSLFCISAADAPSNWQTYSGARIDSDPVILAHFDRTSRYCEPEADRRGSPNPGSYMHVTALRACFYRFGILDRGAYAYPANTLDHFLDR